MFKEVGIVYMFKRLYLDEIGLEYIKWKYKNKRWLKFKESRNIAIDKFDKLYILPILKDIEIDIF